MKFDFAWVRQALGFRPAVSLREAGREYVRAELAKGRTLDELYTEAWGSPNYDEFDQGMLEEVLARMEDV